MARKSKKLNEISKIIDNELGEEKVSIEEIIKNDKAIEMFKTMYEEAETIVDLRVQESTLHTLESILLLVIVSMLAFCNEFTEIYTFAKEHFEALNKICNFEYGLPSLSTIKRVIGIINPQEIENLCGNILKKFIINSKKMGNIYEDDDLKVKDVLSMDGKVANSSDRNSSKNGEVAKTNAMSLYSVKKDIVEATKFIDKKTNEIPTGPILLQMINIKNCLVVFDALSTQEETIKYITGKKANYIAPVKENQKTLFENIKDYFNDKELLEKAKKDGFKVVVEKGHNRYEKREYIFTNDIGWLTNKSKWSKLKSIGIEINTYIDNNDNVIKDIRYFISSIDALKIELISYGIRNEWGIENRLHFYLDTVFKEDDNACFLGNSQKNLNLIRKFCLSTLKQYRNITECKDSINTIRFRIGTNFEYRINELFNILCENF